MFDNKSLPKKILLIATQQIGDVLLCTPLLRSMRMAWPDAIIDVLVYRNAGGILAGNGDCNTILESDRRPGLRAYLKLLKTIYRKYDLAVTTQGNDRAHQYAFLAGKKRIGMIPDLRPKHWWKKWSCMRWSLLDDEHTHTVVQNLLLADLMGIERHYELTPPKSGPSDASLRLNQLVNCTLSDTAYTIVHLLPMWPYKRWTDAGWLSLIQYLLDDGQKVIITGGSARVEIDYAQNLLQHVFSAEQVINAVGKTSFAEMTSLLAHAKAYIGPDTATTHLAAACGTPTLAIFGPTNPVKWAPWPFGYRQQKSPWHRHSKQYQLVNNVMLLQGQGHCVPCHKAGCTNHISSYSKCLDELPAERVIEALCVLLKHTHKIATYRQRIAISPSLSSTPSLLGDVVPNL